MEEKKYHIEESEIAGDKVCEPSPAYRSAASSASSVSSVSWDEAYDTDSYPMGRSLEQLIQLKKQQMILQKQQMTQQMLLQRRAETRSSRSVLQ